MKVLMFGWEYPPHITGGLGTACFGLSHSLAGEGIDLTFVVPKMLGNEPTRNLTLVGAESVVIPFAPTSAGRPKTQVFPTRDESGSNSQPITTAVTIRRMKSSAKVTSIEVDSSLIPYTQPCDEQQKWTVEKWNYVFETETIPVARNNPVKKKHPGRANGYRYSFVGGYGASLMEEISLYARVAAQLAGTNRHDVIHVHDWMTFPAGLEARRISRKPLVLHVHATEFDRTGKCEGAIYQIEKEAMQAADRIIAVSQWTSNILVTRYKINADKISVVHNGVTMTKGVTPEISSPIGSQVVTFLGRITHQKGPRYFIEAARKVAERLPDTRFIVAGSGDLLPQTIERVAQLCLSDRFYFTGFLNKELIDRIWRISRVYVMPSVSEPFGITPLEAIQAGVPVIISNQSGVAEVMKHTLKVDFWDTNALADAICSVLQYDSLSGMLRQNSEGEVKDLSWKKAAQKIKAVYEEMV